MPIIELLPAKGYPTDGTHAAFSNAFDTKVEHGEG